MTIPKSAKDQAAVRSNAELPGLDAGMYRLLFMYRAHAVQQWLNAFRAS